MSIIQMSIENRRDEKHIFVIANEVKQSHEIATGYALAMTV